jgi:NADH-quinone oxidoreductase subunit N
MNSSDILKAAGQPPVPQIMNLIHAILPELILITVACILFLLGISSRVATRRFAALLAFLALAAVFLLQILSRGQFHQLLADPYNTFRLFSFAHYIKLLASGVGMLLVLLNWPTNRDASGSPSLNYGSEACEFFALMLLSIAGLFLVAGPNDIILLFLGIELPSIPTYIMVSISRPLPSAQEAGVKYFFLGAMAAAILLFGFSYLYGTTGSIKLDEISAQFATGLGSWQLLAIVLLIVALAFKIAAVPLHFYAGDVYQGAATPVTAFLAFVPKTSGFVALIKILYAAGGNSWLLPQQIGQLLWILAILTMTVGNVLALMQHNIKRLLAYSSIAHTGYMLVGITTLVQTQNRAGLSGVLFYLAAYGIMNTGAFGALMLLPSRSNQPATSAETFEDLAGQARKHPGVALALAVGCFSLIGLPATVGFFGKFFLILPALQGKLYWLVIFTVINAAISAAYYLRIVGALFLRPQPAETVEPSPTLDRPFPLFASVALSIFATLALGILLPLTQRLTTLTDHSAHLIPPPTPQKIAANNQ